MGLRCLPLGCIISLWSLFWLSRCAPMPDVLQKSLTPDSKLLGHLPCVFVPQASAANPLRAHTLQLLISLLGNLCACQKVENSSWNSPNVERREL